MANEVDVKFSADISDLQKGMQQASAEIGAANQSLRSGAAQMAASFGALSQAYANSAVQRVQAAKDAGDNGLAIAREQEAAKFDIAMNGVKMQEAVLKEAAQTAQISHQQETASLLELENEREAIELRHLQILQSSYDANSSQYAHMQAKIDELASQSALRRTQIELRGNREIYNDYRRTFEQIGSAVSGAIMGMIEGHESLRQAAQKVLLAIIQDFIQARIRSVADWAAGVAAQTAATTTGEAAKTAAVTSGVAARPTAEQGGATAGIGANLAAALQQIRASAGEAFAGVTGFLAPIMGPAAVGPAAGVEATVMAAAAFDQGSWQLPSDQFAMVHKGEMIVPAQQTSWAQSLMSNAAGNGGGDTHNHFSPTIHFTGGAGVTKQALRDQADTLVSILKDAHRRGAFTGFRARPA
jgi:hypothetical protein